MKRHIAVFMMLWLMSVGAPAADVAIFDSPINEADTRKEYPKLLLTEILKKTEPKYGPWEFRFSSVPLQGQRLFLEVKEGVLANITTQFTRPEWESDLLPVRLPIDKGLTSYRIFLINRQDQASFRAIRNVDELRTSKRMGLQTNWATYRLFDDLKFNLVPGTDFEGMFKMLDTQRSDYIARAFHEAFPEQASRKETQPNLAIEDSIALYMPLPRYFFVSPTQPRLAKRIEEGFEMMIKDGSFDRIFMSYHKDLIAQAGVCKRRIFRLKNNSLDDTVPFARKELWFDPFSPSMIAGKVQKPMCPKISR